MYTTIPKVPFLFLWCLMGLGETGMVVCANQLPVNVCPSLDHIKSSEGGASF